MAPYRTKCGGMAGCLAAVLFLAIGFSFEAAAFPQTEADFARLPPYCNARLRGTPEDKRLWEKKLGPDFLHVHHYCSGLNYINHAHGTFDKKIRARLLETSLGAFQYMEDKARPSFVLMPEILVKKGDALRLLDRKVEAAQYYHKALRLNPRHVPAYRALSNLYVAEGRTREARELMAYGLRANPGNKSLQRWLRELEGKSGDRGTALAEEAKPQ
jgi:tetratricopeptide (TPR) repeat protein